MTKHVSYPANPPLIPGGSAWPLLFWLATVTGVVAVGSVVYAVVTL